MFTHVSVKLQDTFFRHLRRPNTRGKNERMARTSRLRVRAELLRLLRGLPTRAGDDEHVLEPVLVQCLARRANRERTLVVREVLGLAIAALHQDARDTAL